MDRSLLEAALENDFILRDGMSLMEATVFKKKRRPEGGASPRFKKKNPGRDTGFADASPSAHWSDDEDFRKVATPKKASADWVDDADFRKITPKKSSVIDDAKDYATRGAEWVKDSILGIGGDEGAMKRAKDTVSDVSTKIGNKVRDLKIGGVASHAAAGATGAAIGGHLMKRHINKKLLKYGPLALGGALAGGVLVGRASKEDR